MGFFCFVLLVAFCERGSCMQHLRNEFCTWRSLVHENVLPLFGACSDFGPFISMVCPWVQNGNLNKYLENRGHALNVVDRFRIVSNFSFVIVSVIAEYLDSFAEWLLVYLTVRCVSFSIWCASLTFSAQCIHTRSSTEILPGCVEAFDCVHSY